MQITVLGATCNVVTAGPLANASAPALIFIHGAANDHDAWHDLMAPLAAAGIRVHAPDLPGHGLSAGKAIDSIEALADWVLALMDGLQLQTASLAGHSMGSLVALAVAARAPGRIERLALLGSTAPMPVAEPLLQSARQTPDAACRMVMTWSHTPSYFVGGGKGSGHGVWGPGKTLAIMRRNQDTLATDLANCNNYATGLEAASAVQCPTLLLLGRRDRMTPVRAVQPLQDALANVTRTEIPDCGHAMMVERPGAVAEALRTFLV